MDKYEELKVERERIEKLKEIMKREAEELFKNFKLKYQYKATKTNLEKNRRVFYRGDEINTLIDVDIRPSPGIGHELAGLNLKARKVAPYIHLDVPKLFKVQQTFLVIGDRTIIPYSQSFMEYDHTLTERSIFILHLIDIRLSSLKEGEEDKIEIFVRLQRGKLLRRHLK